MINRHQKQVELWQISESNDKIFGNDEEYTKIAVIDMAIHERNISKYNSNDNEIISYDMVGLTAYNGNIAKGMYILSEGNRYDIQYVNNSPRLKQVLLMRVE